MNQAFNTDVPADTTRRIISAADQLYEENGKTSFPNVDTVRRRARVNMNDASAVMRIWRRTQTAAAAPLTSSIPDVVQGASQALLAAVWAAATDSANTSLQMAQAGWEQERAEAEACRQQLANAFDSQTEELAIAQRQVEAIEQRLATQQAQCKEATEKMEDFSKRAVDEEARRRTAEARVDEIAKRADDLKAELSRAHANFEHERHDAKFRLEAMESAMSALRDELHQKLIQESDLRQQLARLQGRTDASAGDQQTAHSRGRTKTDSTKRPGANNAKTPNGA